MWCEFFDLSQHNFFQFHKIICINLMQITNSVYSISQASWFQLVCLQNNSIFYQSRSFCQFIWIVTIIIHSLRQCPNQHLLLLESKCLFFDQLTQQIFQVRQLQVVTWETLDEESNIFWCWLFVQTIDQLLLQKGLEFISTHVWWENNFRKSTNFPEVSQAALSHLCPYVFFDFIIKLLTARWQIGGPRKVFTYHSYLLSREIMETSPQENFLHMSIENRGS